MDFHQHIKTRLGDIWILDAAQNNEHKQDSETRQTFESRVLRKMIQQILGEVEITHEANGAPYIIDRPNLNISISHSTNWFAIYLSGIQDIGIDIEIDSTQIDKTKEYFLSKSEIERLQPTSDDLKVCWGIKESVFKMLRGSVKSMKDEIEILSLDKNVAKAKYQNQVINLKFEQSKDFTLVYTG